MNPFKMLGAVVLSILGSKDFNTDDAGHLVLTAEEVEKLNAQMKFAGGSFSEMFKQSFDTAVDASAGGDQDKHELVVNALMDTMRKQVIQEVNQNKETITAELQESFNQKLVTLSNEKKAADKKAEELATKNEELAAQNAILAAGTEPLTPEGTVELKNQNQNMGTAFKANRKLFHNKMAFDFIEGNSAAAIVAMTNQSFGNKSMGGGPSDSIDVSEINEEFGAYLADQATRMTIYKEMLKPTESRKYMTKVLALTEWRDAMARIDSVVQQFIAKWTPLGKAKFTPLKIVNRRHKVNLPVVPDDITGGYLTYLYNEGVTPDQMPVTKYIIDELLRPSIANDIEYKMIATGVFDELTPGNVTEGDAGQAPEKSMDGFLTILKSEDNNVSTQVKFWTPTVQWSEDNSVKYFEDYASWVKKTNPTLAKVGMNVFADPNMEETRQKKYREMFPLTKNTDMGNPKIDFSNLTVVALENMRGSGIIFATPKENFIELHHINEASGATKLFLQLFNYEVRVFAEFWLGVGFAVAEWVFAAMDGPESSGA